MPFRDADPPLRRARDHGALADDDGGARARDASEAVVPHRAVHRRELDLYLYFAIFGAIFEVGAIFAVGTLAWRARHQRSTYWTLAAAIAVTLSLVSWLILVQPVNSAIAHGASWGDLRLRWELGHRVGFALSLAGSVALAIATVRDIPVPQVRTGRRA